MKKVTFILNDGPVAMRSWNALRLAGGMLDVNVAVEIVLFDDAVLCAKKEQNPPEGLEGQKLAGTLAELAGLGVKIWACGTCMKARGIGAQELIKEVQESCLMDVCNSIKDSDNTLVF